MGIYSGFSCVFGLHQAESGSLEAPAGDSEDKQSPQSDSCVFGFLRFGLQLRQKHL